MSRAFHLDSANIFHTVLPYVVFIGAAFVIGVLAGLSPFWAVLLVSGPLGLMLIIAVPNTEAKAGKWPFVFLCAYLFVLTSWPHYAGLRIPGLFQLQPYRVFYSIILLYGIYAIRTNKYIRYEIISVFKENLILCLVFVGFVLFQIIAAYFGKGVIFSLSMLFKETIIPSVLMLLCVTIIREEKHIHYALIAVLLSGCFVSVVGIVESVFEKNIFSSLIPATDEYAIFATTERLRGGRYRAQATFDSPLVLVDFLVTVFPLAIYFAKENVKFLRVLGVVGAVLILLAIIRTQSRAGVGIALVEIAIIYTFIRVNNIRFGTTTAFGWFSVLMAFSSLLLLIPFIGLILETVKGVNAEEVESTSWRIFMVNGAINKFLNFDWYGAGIGYGASSIGIQVPTRSGFAYVLDSYYLTVFADSGLFALLAYVVWSFGIAWYSARLFFNAENKYSTLGLYLSVSVLGFLGMKAISSQMQVFPLFYFLCACILLLNAWKRRGIGVR